jgi:hypothetical protein
MDFQPKKYGAPTVKKALQPSPVQVNPLANTQTAFNGLDLIKPIGT